MGLTSHLFALLALQAGLGFAHPHSHPREKFHARNEELVCPLIPDRLTTGADLIAKVKFRDRDTCEARLSARSIFHPRDEQISTLNADPNDPYSCSEVKPCSNGACCPKETGYCNYGPDACGTNGQSPNDVCWSNCDAKAECGRFADPPNKECPLNVCCSQYGFCGMTEEFCRVTDNEEESCQSNCIQPGSGSSGGDVQKRIIGYYEAWNYKKKCIGMSMEDIPVNSLTHIYYSFAYIQPETYKIVPMSDERDGDLTTETFTEFTALKRKNPSLRAVVALGGWTFNDNNTIWQPVFSDLSSTKAKRAVFIDELVTFMDRYGFDGVDVDWEYPGAPDRGGQPEDGENLTKLFKEMRVELDKMSGKHKEISFTAPTSYWYMRHFDITASAEAVDYVNVMSYDLHGIWDANNPIGSQVLAHSNLTEIDLALDLFWRNNVDPAKINLGIGFYGRSFQLADPACHTPGCLFLGGADPGPCTANSGTLSYREIMDIIDRHELSPYWDEVNAAKYITWNADQWVSYDDEDTIAQKIEFANNLGLGGLLIWAIDLDNDKLDALAAVLHPNGFNEFVDRSTIDPWEELDASHCTVSDCGKEQSVCCPFASAPDPDKCTWRGNGVLCNGQCHPGEVALASGTHAGGGYVCTDGRKFLCCEAENQVPDCRWTECNESCDSDTENELTWKNGNCSGDDEKKFCCSKDQEWRNCEWRGKPGSCFDNHCQTGWQVSLTTSHGGEGHDCGWASKRKRSFCCDLPDGQSPFSPVPLEYLFPDPPSEEDAETDFTLKVDNTWGGAENIPFAETPEHSAFGFIVMTSPDELQTTLDKRDGSHWDVWDCNDAVSEGEHTVRMWCTDHSEDSNCGKIHLGHGASGTIVEMPSGCGPGRYAVVKDMTPSQNQSLPDHLLHRRATEAEPVYDLTFDYGFRRVPRDLGDTQIRIDFGNEDNYWETIVDKAAERKKRSLSKRSNKKPRTLQDVGGSHKRWLEEEWRDDLHGGDLSAEDLHKRWFGEDALEWLRAIFHDVTNVPEFQHEYSEEFVLSIIDQELRCPNMDAKLQVYADMEVNADVNYGFTLIARLGGTYGIDISESYLYFRTGGDVTATFNIDAAVTAFFDTGDVLMFSADTFGAAFSVPGIVTIGPNFKLFGRLEGEATLGVKFETKVKLAEWSVYQTFPVINEDWEPDVFDDAHKTSSQVLEPEFEYGVSLSGHISAHVKPTITFGIDWNSNFASLDSCAVNLVADGHVTFHAEAETGSGGSSFCYGVDVGGDLYATIDAPDMFSWALPESPFMLMPINDVTVFPSALDGEACTTSGSRRLLRRDTLDDIETINNTFSPLSRTRSLNKRATTYGPLVPRIEGLMCPGAVDVDEIPGCGACGEQDDALRKRDGQCWLDPYRSTEEACPADLEATSVDGPSLSKRAPKKATWQHTNGLTIDLPLIDYPSCGSAGSSVIRWYGYPSESGRQCQPELQKLNRNQIDPDEFVTEHVYEAQLLVNFFVWLRDGNMPVGYDNPDAEWIEDVLLGVGTGNRVFVASPWSQNNMWNELALGLGSDQEQGRLALAHGGMNGRKGILFRGQTVSAAIEGSNVLTRRAHRNYAGVFYYMRRTDIWSKFVDTSQYMENIFDDFDGEYPWGTSNAINQGQPTRPARPGGNNLPPAGLRDLYCYWIDMTLAGIEQKAAAWLPTATANFRASYGSDDDGKKWLDNVLKPGAYISVTNLRFNHAAVRHTSPNPSNPNIWQASSYQNLWADDLGPAGPF
ncbi:hypothetical protein S7711_09875 [Stachybotrys chartarum IBT 7711]|uniref:chitinase n=1 Tax=Stachybotrys chartarum (strain CBS 109288 / IBT 7711) TaxID=1280523 RepID=A0A084AGA1_STACB|nr:hypothetical protein S7711_09875 [Stachybotrys chartarum IBT 7711]